MQETPTNATPDVAGSAAKVKRKAEAMPDLAQVLAVNGDNGIAQGQCNQLTQVIAPQGPLVLALQQSAQVVVQGNVQQQNIP